MSLGCKCDLGLSNTGTPNCITIQSVASKLILVPIYDSVGDKNYVSLLSAFGMSDLQTKLYNTDPSRRWFPLGTFENVTMEKAESSFEEAPSGKKVFIKQGKRSFSGELWSTTPTLLGKIQDNRCVEFGVYIVDVNGNLIGSKNVSENRLYPIPVDNQSFDARLMYATDTSVQKIMVAFDFDRLFDESTLWIITPSDTTFNYNFNDAEGLLDVNLIKSGTATTTALYFYANLDYGTGTHGIYVQGLNQSDFTLKKASDGSTIAITAITYTNGLYMASFSAQTAGISVILSMDKDGYVGTLTTTLS